ncbi:2-deoxyglucose-6-phosphate phosphatase [Aspergillus desertorum]
MQARSSAPLATERHVFAGILLDFDGTIIDSTEAIIQNWKNVAAELNIDYRDILRASHGRRAIDVLQELAPTEADWEYVSAMESRTPYLCPTQAAEIPGACDLLQTLTRHSIPHAIVTSGSRALVTAWLTDVVAGKPDPEGYCKAKERLLKACNVRADVLVIEDAPAGIRAGKAAGYRVLAVTTTHSVLELKDAGADWVVSDLRRVRVEGMGSSGVGVVFSDLL